MTFRIVIALIQVVGLIGCVYETPGEFDSTQVVEIFVTPDEGVVADGQTLLEVLVRIDPSTATSEPVVISTNRGVLDPQATPGSLESRKITRKNPGNGEIKVPLRVGIDPGIMVVTATLAGFFSQKTLELAPPEPQPKISFRAREGVDASALLADGSIPGDVVFTHQQGTFEGQTLTISTSDGILDFTVDPSTQDARTTTKVIPAGSQGEQTFPLRVGTTPGVVVLTATIGEIELKEEFTLGAPVFDIDITRNDGTDDLFADGISTMEVLVKLQSGLRPAGQNLLLEASSGSWDGADGSNTLTVENLTQTEIKRRLRLGNTPGTLTITATLEGFSSSSDFDLASSRPTDLVLSSPNSSLVANGGDSLDVTASLFAEDMKLVSRGTRVRFVVCCDDENLSLCEPDKIQLPLFKDLEDGQSVQVTVTSPLIRSDPDNPTDGVHYSIRARAEGQNPDENDGGASPDCDSDEGTTDALPFQLLLEASQ